VQPRTFASPLAALAALSLAAVALSAQTPAPAAKTNSAAKTTQTKTNQTWTQPKTPWGDPDLQGMWPGELHAPLQRPLNLKDRATLTDEELAPREAQLQKQAAADNEEFAKTGQRVGIGPPSYWTERGHTSRQTSLIVDPPDGRLPAMTPEGKKIQEERPAEWRGVANSWEDLSLYYRCVTRGVIGSMMPTAYDNGNQIIQAPGYVVIRQEMIHETRVIPVDGRAHVGAAIRTYMGDSRGHWEGNTLVVETTNFTDKTSIGSNGRAINGEGGPNSEALKLVERFTRTGPDALKYEATVNDPKIWARPWTIDIPFQLDPHYGFYEYACHEGNYAMSGILHGARNDEAAGIKPSTGTRVRPNPAE
jgi:hypothetical protein